MKNIYFIIRKIKQKTKNHISSIDKKKKTANYSYNYDFFRCVNVGIFYLF